MSTPLSPKQVVEQWIDRVWNKREIEAINELADENLKVTITRDIRTESRDEYISFYSQMLAGVDEMRIDVLDCIESGDRVSGVCRVHARKGDKELDYDFGFIGTVVDGKWVDAYNVVDFLEMLKQLGVVDGNLVESALA